MSLTHMHYSLVLESFDLCVFLSVCLLCEMLLTAVPPFPVGQRPTLPHRYHGNTNEREPHRPKLTYSGGALSDVPHEICLATRLEICENRETCTPCLREKKHTVRSKSDRSMPVTLLLVSYRWFSSIWELFQFSLQ